MTLGGLALAVGILVDDATVTIENINWHLEQGKDVEERDPGRRARRSWCRPSSRLLCICIVFVPMFFLGGVAALPVRAAGRGGGVRHARLLRPVAHAGADAWPTTCCARTRRTPTTARAAVAAIRSCASSAASRPASRHRAASIARSRAGAGRRARFSVGFLAVVVAAFLLTPYLGRNFFPPVDSGQILLHVRAPIGTRIEESAKQFCDASRRRSVRSSRPTSSGTLVDNIGMPISGINLSYNNTGVIGSQDGDIQIKLAEDHRPTEDYVRALREELPRRFPDATFAFLPADIVSQILNFGAAGADRRADRRRRPRRRTRLCQPGAAPVCAASPASSTRASSSRPRFPSSTSTSIAPAPNTLGLTERDVTNSLVVNFAGSGQITPTYWLDPEQRRLLFDRHADAAIPARFAERPAKRPGDRRRGGALCRFSAASPTSRARPATAVVSQYNIVPIVQIYAATQGRDLGASAADIAEDHRADPWRRSQGQHACRCSGKMQTMNTAFTGLLLGVFAAIVLIYLLIVVNFQSWPDPLVIIIGASRRPGGHRLDAVRHATRRSTSRR